MTGSVLLLEDDTALRGLLEELLEEEGLAVRACASRTELKAALTKASSDLAIVDAWGASHLELSDSERRELIEVADTVPTILFTARSWATRATADELHVLAIVPKPGDMHDLADLVRRAAAAVVEVKETTERLQHARRATESAQDSALDHIHQSALLLAAVRARLGTPS